MGDNTRGNEDERNRETGCICRQLTIVHYLVFLVARNTMWYLSSIVMVIRDFNIPFLECSHTQERASLTARIKPNPKPTQPNT